LFSAGSLPLKKPYFYLQIYAFAGNTGKFFEADFAQPKPPKIK
jgi:hypothetical protein